MTIEEKREDYDGKGNEMEATKREMNCYRPPGG